MLKKVRLSAAGKKPGFSDMVSLSGRQFLYQLPWYIFIGAPGSGKTTALINSGLQFPAGGKVRHGFDQGRRRHPQLRLVVHRRGGAARHRRPLHDPGVRSRGRQRGLAGISATAEEIASAAADQRRDADGQRVRPAAAIAAGARNPCRRRARAPAGAARTPADPLPDLRAGDQVRPAGRLHGVLRRTRQGRARAGLGHHLRLHRGHQGRAAGRIRQRIRTARKAPARSRDGPHAGRARPDAAGTDLRLPAAVRDHQAAARRVSRTGVCRLEVRGGAADPRRLLHQRHPGRQPDRPRHGHAGARLRHGAQAAAAAGIERPQLLHHQPAAQRGVPRTGRGRHQPALGAQAHAAAMGRLRSRGLAAGRIERRLAGELLAQQVPTSPRWRHACRQCASRSSRCRSATPPMWSA